MSIVLLRNKPVSPLHTGFKSADSHTDDKYGIDVDGIFEIKDILPQEIKQQYRIIVTKEENCLPEDEIRLV